MDAKTVEANVRAGYWGERSLTDVIRELADRRPSRPAIISGDRATSWSEYSEFATMLADVLIGLDLARGDRVGIQMEDGPAVHGAMVGAEMAGLVAVGLGSRAGPREVEYLLKASGTRALMSLDSNRGQSSRLLVEELRSRGVPIEHHLTLPRHLGPGAQVVVDGRLFPTSGIERSIGTIDARRWGPNELFMINSTSGTTGLPKMVTQFQNRWFYYHQLVNRAIELGEDDVFMSLVPAPFGFGLWTAHFVPTISGLPVVVMDQFTPEGALDLIERHRVTIMACVSTQFIMMLNSPRSRATSFGSLRAIFTGGEAVPYNRAAEFEEVTGAKVLQFYGSNETGAYSFTKATDSRDDRLSTCGRSIPEMNPILVDERGLEITSSGGPGQPACRGPACCAGYYNDPEGNAALYTPTGWMLMEDIVTMDDRGFVRLTGRASDFIIRGGKNISAVSVETSVGTHPSVAMVTAIPVPDEVFGERVGVFVELRAESSLTLEELAAYLVDLGVSREGIPEHLFIVDELPRSPGGKIAKGELRAEVLRARQT